MLFSFFSCLFFFFYFNLKICSTEIPIFYLSFENWVKAIITFFVVVSSISCTWVIYNIIYQWCIFSIYVQCIHITEMMLFHFLHIYYIQHITAYSICITSQSTFFLMAVVLSTLMQDLEFPQFQSGRPCNKGIIILRPPILV